MIKITLSPQDQQQLKFYLRTYRDYRIWRRLQAIKLRSQGNNSQKIASILGIRRETISFWVKLFKTQGFDPLLKLNYRGSVSMLTPYKDKLEEIINTFRIPTLAVLQHQIKDTLGIEIGETGLYKWCKKNSLYHLKKLA